MYFSADNHICSALDNLNLSRSIANMVRKCAMVKN